MRPFSSKKSVKMVITIAIIMLMSIASSAQNVWVSSHRTARSKITDRTIQEKVEFLSDKVCEGRSTGTRGSFIASTWISHHFENSRLLKINDTYFHRFATAKGILGTNVIGFLPGGSKSARNRYIIVGAHFDHLGTINGIVYPGADSNASGVAALMSIAEMFSAMKYSGKTWDSSVIFVAFDGNGHNLAGSTALWKMIENGSLKNPITGEKIGRENISLMVNIDQIGCTLSPLRSGREDYIIMLGKRSLRENKREYLADCNRRYLLDMEVSYTYYGSENFTNMFYNLSDQRIFIEKGIPAVMFTSGITMNNNKARDKAASLNYPILRKRIYLMYHWIENML